MSESLDDLRLAAILRLQTLLGEAFTAARTATDEEVLAALFEVILGVKRALAAFK